MLKGKGISITKYIFNTFYGVKMFLKIEGKKILKQTRVLFTFPFNLMAINLFKTLTL